MRLPKETHGLITRVTMERYSTLPVANQSPINKWCDTASKQK